MFFLLLLALKGTSFLFKTTQKVYPFNDLFEWRDSMQPIQLTAYQSDWQKQAIEYQTLLRN
ncbi:phosphohydrolase, partial [Lactiplantibacillus plantarum]|nr:phosphohydrolase [Lactiplantibacillus plantarum]